MAHGGLYGAPYGAVHALGRWAVENWGYFDGSCIFRGIEVRNLGADRLANLIYAVIVDEPDGLVDRFAVRDQLDAYLTGLAPKEPDPTTWGTSDAAKEGLQAAMGAIPMAPPRKKG